MSSVFLSYTARDRPQAQRVAQALEAQGWRVWWDRKIGPGQTYDQTIADALHAAGAVVVLWSAHSVASEWVREEASEAKHRNVLVPVFLEQVELPLGFTLRQAVDLTGWGGSPDAPEFTPLVEAIARILPSTVSAATAATAEPTPQPARRTRILERFGIFATVGLIALVLGVGGAGSWWWDAYYREQGEYFANVTRRWGFPEGTGRLTAAQVARRAVSIALIRHGRRNPVDELRLINAAGNTPPAGTYMPPMSLSDLNPLPLSQDEGIFNNPLMTTTRMTFLRDSNGRPLEESAFTRGGRRLYTLHFAGTDVGEYKRDGFGSPVRESGISYLQFFRVTAGPNAGLDERVTYLDGMQRPQPDEGGECGYRLSLDAQGLIAERVSLDAAGKDYPNTYGVMKEVRAHDALGNITETSLLDEQGTLTLGESREAILRMQYDEVGNTTRVAFYDTQRQLKSVPSLGAAGRNFTYDPQGRLTTGSFFGPDQQLVIGRFGFAKQTIEWLAPDRSLTRFYGVDGHLVPVFGGAFEAVETWNVRGLPIETTYRDQAGVPTRTDEGCSTIRVEYDEVGNMSGLRCLNERKEPILSASGYSLVRRSYNQLGNPLKTEYFDVQDRPGRQGQSYTASQQEFNGFGKIAKQTYLNTGGGAELSRAGYASVVFDYDSRGEQIREAYFDQKGAPTLSVHGFAAMTTKSNPRGATETAYLDLNGRPTRSDRGYAAQRCGSDESGLSERCLYLDERGLPIRNRDGIVSYRLKRNAIRERIEVAFFDERDAPTLTRSPGSSLRRWTYDGAGRELERADYDTKGALMVNAYGYATVKYAYDEHGRQTGVELLDPSGRRLASKVGVDDVERGSVAADAGLRVGDVILTYDGQAVTSVYEFEAKLELFKGDRARVLAVLRDGRTISLDVPPGRLDGLSLQEVVR